MDKNVFSFSYTTSSTAGHRSLYLVTPGNTWQLLGTTGNTISALCWSLLATRGHKLQDMETKCQKVALLSNKWLLVTLCNIWSHQLPDGHIWQLVVTPGNIAAVQKSAISSQCVYKLLFNCIHMATWLLASFVCTQMTHVLEDKRRQVGKVICQKICHKQPMT